MVMERREPEAFYGIGLGVGAEEIAVLKAEVHKTPRKRIRLCTHSDTDAALHEMFVCYTKDTDIGAHKHTDKDETFYVMEGEMDFVVFDDAGRVTTTLPMGGAGEPFCVRVPINTWHTVRLKTDYCVIHLSNVGPFAKDRTVWAQWA
jgi:cupin fold WbuC family metalloprotein